MSIPVISAVFESALKPHLRLTALALANFAADDGTSIYPSVQTLAKMAGKGPRSIKSDLRALRDLGVLVPDDNLRGGRRRTTRYSMNLSALRTCGPGCDTTVQRGSSFVGDERVRDSASFRLPAGRTAGVGRVYPEAQTVQSTAESVQSATPDPSGDPSMIRRTKPPRSRRARPRAEEDGQEQFADLSTSLCDHEGRPSSVSRPLRDRPDGDDQNGGGESSPPVQHRDRLAGDECGATRSPLPDIDGGQQRGTEALRSGAEPDKANPSAAQEDTSVLDKLIAQMKQDRVPIPDGWERRRRQRQGGRQPSGS